MMTESSFLGPFNLGELCLYANLRQNNVLFQKSFSSSHEKLSN